MENALLKKHGTVRITNGVEGIPGASNIWELTNGGEGYAEYIYENRMDELLIEE